MTLNELLDQLKSIPANAALLFVTEQGEIGYGYHVTEFKRSQIAGIDCGGRKSEWMEASMQLLDGSGDKPMRVGKFIRILDHSIRQLAGLGRAPVHVEFAPGNIGMRTYEMTPPELVGDRVLVRLDENRALCKPAQDRRGAPAVSGCRPSTTATQPCCV